MPDFRIRSMIPDKRMDQPDIKIRSIFLF